MTTYYPGGYVMDDDERAGEQSEVNWSLWVDWAYAGFRDGLGLDNTRRVVREEENLFQQWIEVCQDAFRDDGSANNALELGRVFGCSVRLRQQSLPAARGSWRLVGQEELLSVGTRVFCYYAEERPSYTSLGTVTSAPDDHDMYGIRLDTGAMIGLAANRLAVPIGSESGDEPTEALLERLGRLGMDQRRIRSILLDEDWTPFVSAGIREVLGAVAELLRGKEAAQ